MANKKYRVIKYGSTFKIQYKFPASDWYDSSTVGLFDLLPEATAYVDELVTRCRDTEKPTVLYEAEV